MTPWAREVAIRSPLLSSVQLLMDASWWLMLAAARLLAIAGWYPRRQGILALLWWSCCGGILKGQTVCVAMRITAIPVLGF